MVLINSNRTKKEEKKNQSQLLLDFEYFFTRAIEFRQETIYFLITDRFNDGDTSNNPGSNLILHDSTRQQWSKYWG